MPNLHGVFTTEEGSVMRVQLFPLAATTIAIAAALSLAACDKPNDDRTVGQKIDSAIAKTSYPNARRRCDSTDYGR